jgi:hypothetical protein
METCSSETDSIGGAANDVVEELAVYPLAKRAHYHWNQENPY